MRMVQPRQMHEHGTRLRQWVRLEDKKRLVSRPLHLLQDKYVQGKLLRPAGKGLTSRAGASGAGRAKPRLGGLPAENSSSSLCSL